MTNPEHHPQHHRVIPGYFGPAEAAPVSVPVTQAQAPQPLGQQVQEWQMPASVPPYVTPSMSYGSADSASQPMVGATPLQAVGRFYKKYGTFSGRASRSEFWWVLFFMAAVFVITAMVNSATSDWVVNAYITFVFVSFVPMLALTARRLHDANLPGLLTILVLIPWVGFLIIGGLACKSSKPGGSRFDRLQPERARLQARKHQR
ncbi:MULTISPECIES: DUF805 domain-containing protein [Arthrobacter]|uniref:DUF805 domain-containing protein n=1 Tax=Arthrobacter psychrochitiniphilus TaxID=291045 RepID=A0A2V3DRH7_9MICC|nr:MULTISPECIES: DUF805 domain-containing protein [Arthrobacter]NYG17615.1 uncharacterized membrane protein YhaH (DUF805 family) [Arthrobacter psychrochitiniphilus]PXA65311.1 hypothetical protein CVS29_11675 [Arthrobacter psychrochitiniphilus]